MCDSILSDVFVEYSVKIGSAFDASLWSGLLVEAGLALNQVVKSATLAEDLFLVEDFDYARNLQLSLSLVVSISLTISTGE